MKFSRKNKSRKHKLKKSRKHVGGLGSDTDEAIEKLFDSAIEESKEARRREEAIEPSRIIPAKRVTISCGFWHTIDYDSRKVIFSAHQFPNGIGVGSRVVFSDTFKDTMNPPMVVGPQAGAVVEAIDILNGVTFSGPFVKGTISYGGGFNGILVIFETEINA